MWEARPRISIDRFLHLLSSPCFAPSKATRQLEATITMASVINNLFGGKPSATPESAQAAGDAGKNIQSIRLQLMTC
jgi:hypothetical protein